jgi:UDP-2,3-diacylglucosamine hydrolase
MNSVLLLSDLHLGPETTRLNEHFGRLMRHAAGRYPAVYILGDLFDAWVGDDDDEPYVADAAAAIADASRHGPVYFVHGNRDFLLGPDFARRCGMTLLAELTRIPLAGVDTVLLHGDSLCTDDVQYQAFRRTARDPKWQAAMLAQPLAVRRHLAAQARQQSREHQAGSMDAILDVNPAAVESLFRSTDVARMIHGHTHRPARHFQDVDGRTVERLVLGDWGKTCPVTVLDADGPRTVDASELA